MKPRIKLLTGMPKNIALLFGSLTLCFVVIEVGYRIIDPFPYFGDSELTQSERGTLSEYDPVLGWKGVPDAEARLVTHNCNVGLSHNKHGFRDIEHDYSKNEKPAIVFLGDSFTWGYEVEFEEMFVNRLRLMLPDYEIFNLAHRASGTDQQFLTFQQRDYHGPLELVVLVFCGNDIIENNHSEFCGKPKPKYEIVNDDLVLTGVPVPRTDRRDNNQAKRRKRRSSREKIAGFVFSSHFLHDVWIRYKNVRRRFSNSYDPKIQLAVYSQEVASRVVGYHSNLSHSART